MVVTGLGVVSSIGIGVESFTEGLSSGRSGVSPVSVIDMTGFASRKGCEVHGFEPRRWFSRTDPRNLGRASQFSVAAAAMALADARVDPVSLTQERGIISVGTTDGESQDLDHMTETCVRQGPAMIEGKVARRVPASWLSTSIAREFQLRRVESITIPTACAAGNYAIGYAYDALSAGEAGYALCGGSDAMCRKTLAGFYRLGTIAPDMCQPFDKDRQGILTGEGSGILFLEPLESARARGAQVYAEILGYGVNCDASHMVAPDRSSIADCMRRAHRQAGIRPGDVDMIAAHGTGTRANDVTEASAIREVFGENPPPTVSIKSMIGHTMGAASALAAIACSIALKRGFIPPTINHRETDPECGVDCVPNVMRSADLEIVQNNAFAFGGNNAIVVLARL